MDRGERRRRDECYVKWLMRQMKFVVKWFPKGIEHRKLGAKKARQIPCRCSKKTPGKPKIARGCCYGYWDSSPKIARGRWKIDIERDA